MGTINYTGKRPDVKKVQQLIEDWQDEQHRSDQIRAGWVGTFTGTVSDGRDGQLDVAITHGRDETAIPDVNQELADYLTKHGHPARKA